MTVTLTLDEELVRRLQLLAESRHLALDEMLAEFVDRACEPPGAGDEFVRLATEHAGCSEPGWRFSREECHDRPSLRPWNDR